MKEKLVLNKRIIKIKKPRQGGKNCSYCYFSLFCPAAQYLFDIDIKKCSQENKYCYVRDFKTEEIIEKMSEVLYDKNATEEGIDSLYSKLVKQIDDPTDDFLFVCKNIIEKKFKKGE